jgi:hypothetical protein
MRHMRPAVPYQGESSGLLSGALTWIAARKDPTLQTQQRAPLWARRPFVWLGQKALKLAFKAVALPFVGLRRKRLAPFAATFWMATASAAASFVHNGWHTVAAFALLGAPIVWRQVGLPLGRITRDTGHGLDMAIRRMGAYVTGAGLAVATATNPHLLLVSPGLYLVWAPLAAWATSYWGNKPTAPKPETKTAAAPEIDKRIAHWNARVAPKLGGARLTDLDDLPAVKGGWTATIDLSDTDKTFADLTATGVTGFIAARFKLPPTSVQIVPHQSRRGDLGTLMVYEVNPLQDVQKFKELSFNNGTVVVGKRADGGPAKWDLYRPGFGACHGFIFGVTGAGKSGLLDVLLIEARHSGTVCTLLADPHNGKSFPDWMDNVTVFAGKIPRIHAMLVGVERMMEERKSHSGQETFVDAMGRTRRKGGGFFPTRENPIIMVFLDEWPKIAQDPIYGPDCVRIVAKIGEDGRKFGIGAVTVAQMPDVDKNGGDRSVRSNMSGMNLAAFRTSDSVSGNIGIPVSLPIDPKDLPDKWPDGSSTAGYGYLARDEDATSPMRSLFSPGQDHEDELIEWATSGDPAALPGNLMTVAGPFFYSWRELLDVTDGDVVAIGPNGEHWRAGDDEAASVEPAAPASQGSGGTVRAWDLLKAALEERPHGATTATLRDATGLGQPTVRTTLVRRSEKGHAHELAGGVWKLGPAPELAEVAA